MNEIRSLGYHHGNMEAERKKNVNWATWESENSKSVWTLEMPQDVIFNKNKRGNPQRAATIGIWDMGDHTSKKIFEGKVYPGDPEKKFFSTKNFFGEKQKLGKKIFRAWPRKKFFSKIFFVGKKTKIEKKCFFLGVAHETMEKKNNRIFF